MTDSEKILLLQQLHELPAWKLLKEYVAEKMIEPIKHELCYSEQTDELTIKAQKLQLSICETLLILPETIILELTEPNKEENLDPFPEQKFEK